MGETDKPIPTSADGAGMEQASTTEKINAGNGWLEDEAPKSAEEAAQQIGGA